MDEDVLLYKENKMHVAGAHTGDGDDDDDDAVHGTTAYALALANYCHAGIKHMRKATQPAEQKAQDRAAAKELQAEVRAYLLCTPLCTPSV